SASAGAVAELDARVLGAAHDHGVVAAGLVEDEAVAAALEGGIAAARPARDAAGDVVAASTVGVLDGHVAVARGAVGEGHAEAAGRHARVARAGGRGHVEAARERRRYGERRDGREVEGGGARGDSEAVHRHTPWWKSA